MHHIRAILLLSTLELAGCATPYDPTPNIHDTTPATAPRAKQDVSDCAIYAKAYKRPLSVSGVAAATGQGAVSNLPTATNPAGYLGPLLGGVGGLLSALFQYAGLIDTDTPRADQQCVRQRLDRDHAGILVEPPL